MSKAISTSLQIPRQQGCYILVLALLEDESIVVGKLGAFRFQKGYYLYVGSALGESGLAGRIRHHLQPGKLHWHIDYLRAAAQLVEIWISDTRQRKECNWAERLAAFLPLSRPYIGFGSSDCRCISHLFYCPSAAALDQLRRTVQEQGMKGICQSSD